MEKFKVKESGSDRIVFLSISDLENAYNQLADGKDIIVIQENDRFRKGEIIPGKVFSNIVDGKMKLETIEETNQGGKNG